LEKEEKKAKEARNNPLQTYVKKMREKGFTDIHIKLKLKSKSWTEKEIKAAMQT